MTRIWLTITILSTGIAKIFNYSATADLMVAYGVPAYLLPLVILLDVGGRADIMLYYSCIYYCLYSDFASSFGIC